MLRNKWSLRLHSINPELFVREEIEFELRARGKETRVRELTSQFDPTDVFNADETGLNFKMLPSKSLAARTEVAAPGYKRSKERVTISACSNF